MFSNMERRTGLPLLKLPYLVLREVLKNLEPLEVVRLSKTSRKCKNSIRGLKKNEYEGDLSIHENPYLTVYSTGYPNYIPLFHERPRNQSCLVQLMEEMENIRAVLNIKIEKLNYHMRLFESENKFFVDWLKQYYPVIGSAELTGNNVSHGDLEYFFEKIQITDSLTLGVETDEKKEVEIPKNLRLLRVDKGEWIGLEQLLKLDCAEIRLRNTSLTKNDLYWFLDSWKTWNSHQNLERLYLTLTASENPRREIAHFVSYLNVDGIFLGRYAFVRYADGRIASITPHEDWKTVSFSFTVFNETAF